MQWIDEKDLVTWAKRTDARALLVDMVADLIRATIPDANRYRFRFPGGDVGQVRGWDGDLETVEAVGFIPVPASPSGNSERVPGLLRRQKTTKSVQRRLLLKS
ncbi:hypothetical protein AB2I50_18115 [Escherichia coli]